MIKTSLVSAKDIQEIPPSPALQLTPAPSEPDREPVLILIIGSAKGIDKIVRTLYKCRFAEVQEWSKLLPAFTPGRLMRSLIRHVLVD